MISDDGRNTLYGLVKDKEGNDSGNSARSSIKQIFLVLDNISIHKSNKVKENLARYLPRIQLVFLPTRSPELNLIAVIWLWLRIRAINNSTFEDDSEIDKVVSVWTCYYTKA